MDVVLLRRINAWPILLGKGRGLEFPLGERLTLEWFSSSSHSRTIWVQQ